MESNKTKQGVNFMTKRKHCYWGKFAYNTNGLVTRRVNLSVAEKKCKISNSILKLITEGSDPHKQFQNFSIFFKALSSDEKLFS